MTALGVPAAYRDGCARIPEGFCDGPSQYSRVSDDDGHLSVKIKNVIRHEEKSSA